MHDIKTKTITVKDPDAGKDCGQKEKGTTEDEMVGWHHWHNGHRFGRTPGFGDGQGGLACCGSWGRKELDLTERLNWIELILVGVRWHLIMVLICTSVVVSDVDLFSSLAICVPFLEKCLFRLCLHFIWVFLLFSCMNSLYIVAMNSLSDVWCKYFLLLCR